MRSDFPEGYEVPIHRALTERIMIAGLERRVFYILWTLNAAILFGLQQLWYLPIALGLHFAGARLAKHEPYFWELLIDRLKTADRYEP